MPALLTRMSISTPWPSKCSKAARTALHRRRRRRAFDLMPSLDKGPGGSGQFLLVTAVEDDSRACRREAPRHRSPRPSDEPVTSAVLPLRSNKLGQNS